MPKTTGYYPVKSTTGGPKNRMSKGKRKMRDNATRGSLPFQDRELNNGFRYLSGGTDITTTLLGINPENPADVVTGPINFWKGAGKALGVWK